MTLRTSAFTRTKAMAMALKSALATAVITTIETAISVAVATDIGRGNMFDDAEAKSSMETGHPVTFHLGARLGEVVTAVAAVVIAATAVHFAIACARTRR